MDWNKKKADSYACDVLIPKESLNHFKDKKTFTEKSICLFAESINIHPGIVVGRLQKDGEIPFNYFNNIKEQYMISV